MTTPKLGFTGAAVLAISVDQLDEAFTHERRGLVR